MPRPNLSSPLSILLAGVLVILLLLASTSASTRAISSHLASTATLTPCLDDDSDAALDCQDERSFMTADAEDALTAASGSLPIRCPKRNHYFYAGKRHCHARQPNHNHNHDRLTNWFKRNGYYHAYIPECLDRYYTNYRGWYCFRSRYTSTDTHPGNESELCARDTSDDYWYWPGPCTIAAVLRSAASGRGEREREWVVCPQARGWS